MSADDGGVLMGLKSYELGGLLAFWSVFFTLLSYITFDPTGASSCAPTRVRARHVLAPTARTRLRHGARSVTPAGTGRMSSHHSRSHRTPARITPARITAAPTSRARSPHVCRSLTRCFALSPSAESAVAMGFASGFMWISEQMPFLCSLSIVLGGLYGAFKYRATVTKYMSRLLGGKRRR